MYNCFPEELKFTIKNKTPIFQMNEKWGLMIATKNRLFHYNFLSGIGTFAFQIDIVNTPRESL